MRLALPVQQAFGRGLGQALPPNGLLHGIQGHIGEDGTFMGASQGVGVALGIGAGRHAEEAGLGIDGIETSVIAHTQPGDVIAQGPDLITLLAVIRGGQHHGQVGLAAGGGERGGHILFLAVGIFNTQDQHMFSHPALVLALEGGDAQGEALLAQQHVSAVAGVDGPNGVILGELQNVALLIVQLAFAVQAADEVIGIAQLVHDGLAHAGHDGHTDHDIDGIGDLDAHLRKAGGHRAHAERNDIHGTALHGAAQHIGSHGIGLLGVHPVVGGAAVLLLAGADKGPALHAGNIVQRGAVIIASRQLFLIQLDQLAGSHGLPAQLFQLFFTSVDPDNLIGAGQFGSVLNELQNGLVRGQRHNFTLQNI